MRDNQKSRAYRAEDMLRTLYDRSVESNNPTVELEGVVLTLPPEVKFASIESLQQYCDQVTNLLGVSSVRVRDRKGSGSAHYCMGEIAVHSGRKNCAMREIVVLHELSHHVTHSYHTASHGAEFVANYIDILTKVMGPQVGLALRIINDTERVKEGVS